MYKISCDSDEDMTESLLYRNLPQQKFNLNMPILC